MKKITLRDLHEINNKYPDKKNLHQTYQYDVRKNEWVFKGFTCSQCGRQFKRPGFIDVHEQKCNPDRKLASKKPDGEYIVNVNREVWSPIDINQNQSTGKTK